MLTKVTERKASGTKAINTEVPADIWTRFKILSVRRGVLVREQLAHALTLYLEKNKA